jgi:hypothetical protein
MAKNRIVYPLMIGYVIYFVSGVVRWFYVGGDIDEYVGTFFVECLAFMLILCLLNIAIVIVNFFKRRWLDGR